MIEEFNLQKLIRQSVEQQIKDNDPPATKETYERLIKNGDDESTAMEKIISTIAEEIFESLNKDRKINEKTYSEKLRKLE